MQELEDIEENSENSPEPHFLDREDMDAESIQEEEKKSLKWAIQQLHKEDANLKKKLEASKQVKDLEDALGGMGSDNEKANEILEEAKSRLASLSIEEDDEEPLTLSQMTERQRSIQHKIKTASERLKKLEGKRESEKVSEKNDTDTEEAEKEEISELNEEESSDLVDDPSVVAEEIEEKELSEELEDSSESETIQDENIKPEQASVAQKGLPVIKDVGEGILQPAKPLDTVAVKGIKPEEEQSVETDENPAPTESSIANESNKAQQEEIKETVDLSNMSEADKIVQEREALFSQALQDLKTGADIIETPEEISTSDENLVTDVFDEIKEEITPSSPTAIEDFSKSGQKTYQAQGLKSEKLQRLMNLSYRISGKKPKAKFIEPGKSISNQIKLRKPIKRMEDETTIRTMEPVDVAQPESHLVTVTCRPDTKRLVTEVAEELGISPNELLDRGISAVCRMILRNNGRVTFPIEVQQIDLGD